MRQSTKRASIPRAGGASVRAFTTYLPLPLAKKLRVRCAEQDVAVSEFLKAAAEAAIERKPHG